MFNKVTALHCSCTDHNKEERETNDFAYINVTTLVKNI